MAISTPNFTPETAKQFDRYSVSNAATLKETLPCGCEPYVAVFTYRRWKAQGFQVQRGEKAIRLPLIYQRAEKDPKTGEQTTSRRMGRSAVFCRCQVKPVPGCQLVRDRSTCGGYGSLAGRRLYRSCAGTGSRVSR